MNCIHDHNNNNISSNNNNNNKVQQFAVYGTLRDDDDSGADWTKSFLNGAILPAQYARVYGFKMLYKRKKDENWPFAVETNDSNDFIVVKIITFPTPQIFDAKLLEADIIEVYDAQCPSNGDYQRRVVTCHMMINGEVSMAQQQHAVMYYAEKMKGDHVLYHVPGGDWLQREECLI